MNESMRMEHGACREVIGSIILYHHHYICSNHHSTHFHFFSIEFGGSRAAERQKTSPAFRDAEEIV